MISILNTSNPLSRNQILLALYEGGGHENYEVVKLIFKPVYDKIYAWANNINNNNNNTLYNINSQCGTHFCVYCKSNDRSKSSELRDYNHHMQQLQAFNNNSRIMNTAQQYFNCI